MTDASSRKDVDYKPRQISNVDFPSDVKELKEDEAVKENCFSDNKPADDLGEDKSCQMGQLDSSMIVEDLGCENVLESVPKELSNQLNSGQEDQSECHDDKVADIIRVKDITLDNKLVGEDWSTLEEADSKSKEASAGLDDNLAMESDVTERHDNEEQDCKLGHVFEPWCVFVEFGRTEASCTAAHCLHGRLFDNRIVTVEYVSLDLYLGKFPK